MKALIFVSTLALMASVTAQAKEPKGEIGYQTGELGYDALLAGDNQRAAEQILARADENTADPAKLLNLGRAYQRMGRNADAMRLFQAAMDSRDVFDVELADGSVMSSREAARLALLPYMPRMASR